MPVPQAIRGALEAPSGAESGAIPRVKKLCDPFVLVFSPLCFDVVHLKGKIGDVALDGDYWLPTATPKPIVAGAGGIEMAPASRPASAQTERGQYSAREMLGTKELGETWIRPDEPAGLVSAEFLPKGVAPGSYRRSMLAVATGMTEPVRHHLTAWDSYEVIVPSRPAVHTFDRDNYHLWIASLVLAGKIEPANARLCQQRAAQLAGRVARVKALPLADDDRKLRIDEATSRATTVRAAKVLEAA